MKVLKNLFGKGDKIHVDEIAVAPGLLLGNAVIVESGSNSNGSYIKFGNGIMMCYRIIQLTANMSGNVDFPMPAHFIEPATGENLNVVAFDNATLGGLAQIRIKNNIAVSARGSVWRIYVTEGIIDSPRNWGVGAIGRWK